MNHRVGRMHGMWAAALAVALTACGGGGGGDDDGSSTEPPPGGGTTATGTYRIETPPATAQAALQQLDQLGAAGNAWVSGVASYAQPTQLGQLYLDSSLRSSSTFDYALDAEPATAADLLAQLNQRGQQGYAYKGGYAFGTTQSVFVKDSAKTATYTYENLTASVNGSVATQLAQLNEQGARGFRWLGTRSTSAAPMAFINLYVKDSTGPATYTYTANSLGAAFSPANGTALLAALQQGAADGSRFLGTFLAGAESAMLFERPAGSSAAVVYSIESVSGTESLAQMLAAVNARAAEGEFFWSDLVTADGAFHRVYVEGQVLPHPLYGPVHP